MNAQCLWIVGELGILVEIVGAGLIVFFAYSAKRRVATLETHMDGIQQAVDTLIDEVRSQFRKQITGFLLLGLGLIMQLVGNFSNVGN